MEGFSDTVFGFALTLLVVSLEVPSSFEGLINQMTGFYGFALMFAMVCWIWYEHNWFFRRTGLQDPWTVVLNCVLLFVVLFYVYPMKFLTAALIYEFFGQGEVDGPRFAASSGATLMVLYSAGVVLIFGVFLMLYRHASRRRHLFRLSPEDDVMFTYARRGHLISMSLGLVSIALAVAVPRYAALSGFIYFLMGPLHAWNGHLAGRAIAALPPAVGLDRSGN
ncbi:MAG TPA: TMEM175 family protein [Vicinamibacterales bacterium]|nr:TMEM175 family protein [Vicinamibacterales bacterium]